MNSFKDLSREVWSEMRAGTAYEQPQPDTGDYTADFYGTKKGEGVKFDQLIDFLDDAYRDASLVFNWEDFAAPASYEYYNVRDGEGGFVQRMRIIDHNVPFVYTNANNQKIETAFSVKLNRRKDYLDAYWAFSLEIDSVKKYIAASMCFYYDNTEKYRKNASDTLELNDFRIEQKYIAVMLTSENLTDFCALVEVIAGKRDADYVREQISKKYAQKIKSASNAVELKFLYENVPDFAFGMVSTYIDFKLATEHLSILKSYDDTGWFSMFKDSSGAVINLFRVVGDSKLLYQMFLGNPVLVKELYQNMDGLSVVDGIEQTNRWIFVNLLFALSLSNQYEGAAKTAAIFRTGKNYRLNSNVLAFNDKEKDAIYLQQLVGKQEPRTLHVLDDIPRYSEKMTVEATAFYPQDDGAYYHPLSAVLLIVEDTVGESAFQVPAMYVKALSDEAEWQDIALALRIGGNVLAIVLGIVTLGTGSPLLIALAAADITLATADTLVAISQDPLMQSADGQEFLKTWDKVYLAGGIATAAPLLVGNAFSAGAKLLSKATLSTTKNFLRASLLKMTMELNIPNFTTSTLKVLDSGAEVYHATYSVIQMNTATRLQQAGVLFVQGELTGGRTAKNGLVVIYKGEVIASGEAKAVKKSLGDIWKLKGAKLTEALESRLGLKNIDEAVQRLGINITVPKNTLNFVDSHKRLQRIIRSLETKIPSKIFNPNKKALKELGIKLPKSKTGLSVDFADSPYLYPVTGNQKNIVKIKLTGARRNDDRLAYELAGIKVDVSILDNYTWHHLDDYDSVLGTCTVQLVESKIHTACYPHYGAVSLIENFFTLKYK